MNQSASSEESPEKQGVSHGGERTVDDFVVVEPQDHRHKIFEEHGPSLFAQLQAQLKLQYDKCKHYQNVFEIQDNPAMATRFEAYAAVTTNHLEVLEANRRNKEWLPPFNYELINFNATPFNPDVKEKELQLVVRTKNLQKDVRSYIVAEFEFAHPSEEPISQILSRWYHYSKIKPKTLCYCTAAKHQQYDRIDSIDTVPFDDLFTPNCLYNRPISFFVDKGKSRTLKRKFKPVKLTFYEKKSSLNYSKKIGTVQVKIDAINDDSTFLTRIPISNGRKLRDGIAEIRVKVREPLVDKAPRPYEEKLLTFV